jgi:hypothetical protein
LAGVLDLVGMLDGVAGQVEMLLNHFELVYKEQYRHGIRVLDSSASPACLQLSFPG